MNTFFHFKGISCFPFLGNDMWPSHQSIFELSYEESLLFQHKSTAPMIYILTFENNLLPGKYFSHFLENRFHLLGNLKITFYQINTFFHFWGTSCFLFLRNDMWPSHQPIFELSYEENLLFQHKSTAPMIYILTFENNLLPGKYFSQFWDNRFHLLGNLKITLYQINTFFHFWGTSCFLFWEMTCDLVTNRFLELSYEESLLFSHKSTAPMIYILTLGNNLWNSTSGKINYTASVFRFFDYVSLLITLSISA